VWRTRVPAAATDSPTGVTSHMELERGTIDQRTTESVTSLPPGDARNTK
jgi:hypothetical protein